MNTPPAPDVDRVMDRMGRSAFGYRSFPNPVDEAAAFAAAPPPPAASAGVFALIGDALPDALPDALADAPPETLPASAHAHAAHALPQPPGPRPTSLDDMFRLLSGHARDTGYWADGRAREAAFPFRRR